MKSYTLSTSRQALAAGNRNSRIARQPVMTGYGLRGQVERRESAEPVIIEWDEQSGTRIYMVASKFPGLYFQVAKIDGMWRCTAKEEADKAACIYKALSFKNAPERKARISARHAAARHVAAFARVVEAFSHADEAWQAMSIDERLARHAA